MHPPWPWHGEGSGDALTAPKPLAPLLSHQGAATQGWEQAEMSPAPQIASCWPRGDNGGWQPQPQRQAEGDEPGEDLSFPVPGATDGDTGSTQPPGAPLCAVIWKGSSHSEAVRIRLPRAGTSRLQKPSAGETAPSQRQPHHGQGGERGRGARDGRGTIPQCPSLPGTPKRGDECQPRSFSQESVDGSISALAGPFFSWQQFTM